METFDIKSYLEQKPTCLKLTKSYPEKNPNVLIVLLVPCMYSVLCFLVLANLIVKRIKSLKLA